MGLPQLRWWDNYAWTEFTSAARTPLVMQDEPRLAYADDDLPSRRSQREQRDRTSQDSARQRTGAGADLASTLRQLEPPKPQNIERSQPAPTFTDTPAAASATDQASHFSAGTQYGEQQHASQQDSSQQYGGQQFGGQQHSGSQFGAGQTSATSAPSAPEQEYDPFAEFLAEPTTPRETGRQAGGFPEQPQFGGQPSFTEQPAFEQSPFEQLPFSDQTTAAGFGQQQSANQFAQQSGRDGQGQYGFGQSRIAVHTPLAYTPFVWIIAMIPLIQLVGILLVVSAVDVTMAFPFLVAIGLGPYAAVIPLAIADRRQLLRMGHQRPAHWAWTVLTAPAYLVARAIAASREQGKGLTPLLVWASLSLLQVASIIAVPGILISAMPAVFSAEVEESIEADSAIAGRELAVDCPATPPVQIGGTFNCTGVLASTGEEVGIVVRLQRANGWIDWRVYGMVWENSTNEAADEPIQEAPAGEDEAPVGIVEGEATS